MENLDLSRLERDVYRDYLQDGLFDIMFGLYFLFVGLLILGDTMGPLIFIWVIILAPIFLKSLKKRTSFPRTGYVELRQGDPQPLPWFVLGSGVLGVAVLIAVFVSKGILAQPAEWYRWMPIFFGIWMAGLFMGLGVRVRMPHYYVLAVLALIGGPASALLEVEGKLANIGLFFMSLGAIALVWGVISFVLFLVRNPLPANGAADLNG